MQFRSSSNAMRQCRFRIAAAQAPQHGRSIEARWGQFNSSMGASFEAAREKRAISLRAAWKQH
eukprot:9138106-Lingulodinium_polyedra.AAC.1